MLGGSIAGLLAARVLADHAATVMIIERDDRDGEAGGAGRPGAPHGQQAHVLLPAGHGQLERWFPGLTQEAQDEGAVLLGRASKLSDWAYMTAHPASLAAPGTVLRAIAVNIRGRKATR